MARSISTLDLLRYLIGYVFVASGLMKLVGSDFTATFAAIGIPYPDTVVLIVAITEVVCGGLITFNYYVKNATIPLLIIIIGALLLTKIPILHAGFFQFAFEARLDIVTLGMLSIIWKSYP